MRVLLIVIASLVTTSAYGQIEVKTTDSLYIVTYTTGSSWDHTKAPNDQPHFKEHSTRLGQLRKDGVIKFGARYGDKGSIVIATKNFQSAKEIINADAAVANKLFNADIQKLNIFYDGCLERVK